MAEKTQEMMYIPGQSLEGSAEEMFLNMGPHHPSTHGVMRFVVRTDGEVMTTARPDVGFLHRGIEKIAEGLNYPLFTPYTDRIDYLAAMNLNWAYALAVERLAEIEVPRRAELIRILVAELNRIMSHLLFAGCMTMDIGAVTPFTHTLRERETIMDLFEEICGNRITYNYIRLGGVSCDLPEGFLEKVEAFLDHFELTIDEINRLISFNRLYQERTVGVACVDRETAIAYGLVGPNLRASGVDWDLRRDEPYGLYPEVFEKMAEAGQPFQVPTGHQGDCYDRYMVRIGEMEQSCRLVRTLFPLLKECTGEPTMAKMKRLFKPPAGEIYVRSESARGEIGVYLVSDGGPKPVRLRFRTGSYTAIGIVEKVSPGLMIADLVALISALDVIAPEIDR